MNSEADFTSRILSALNDLPAKDQLDVMLAVISAALKNMPLDRIMTIRAEIAVELSGDIPLVGAALELIDGQIALREIGGAEDWR